MIPACLKLTPEQKEKLHKWHDTLPIPDDFEGCCCGAFVQFTVRDTGIGDNIEASGLGRSINLSLDDYGKLIED